MTEYESAGSWNELLDVLESRLTDKVNIEIEEAKQSRLVGSTAYSISMRLSTLLRKRLR